jgi:hypothetical protein
MFLDQIGLAFAFGNHFDVVEVQAITQSTTFAHICANFLFVSHD